MVRFRIVSFAKSSRHPYNSRKVTAIITLFLPVGYVLEVIYSEYCKKGQKLILKHKNKIPGQIWKLTSVKVW